MLLIVLTVASTISISAQNTMIREHQSARRLVTCSILDGRIEHLCDSLCEGRGSGQRGGGLAAIWLQREFERIGLMRMSGGYAHAVKLGDGKYGNGNVNRKYHETRQALYSYKLSFEFKTDAGMLEYLNGKTFTVEDVPFQEKYFSKN